MSKEIHKDSPVSHLILECLVNTIGNKRKFHNFIADKKVNGKDYVFDVKLFVNGLELNIKKFIERWDKQVDKAISKEAKRVFDGKFCDVTSILEDLHKRIGKEVEKHRGLGKR
jgi:hypothetical protein